MYLREGIALTHFESLNEIQLQGCKRLSPCILYYLLVLPVPGTCTKCKANLLAKVSLFILAGVQFSVC